MHPRRAPPPRAGKRICIVHAITKKGPLCTRDATSGVPHYGDEFVRSGSGKALKPRAMGDGEHTAEYLFMGKKSKDYHDSMNSTNFGEWVDQRLVPTFEANYPGKRMILVLDNAPCVARVNVPFCHARV